MAGLNFKTGGTGLASQTRGERGQPIASRPSTNIVDKYNLQGFPPRILILLNYISDLGDNFLRCRGFLPSETAHKQNISRLGDRDSKPHESPRSTPPEPYYLSRANRQKANSRLSKRSDPELATPAELHVRSTFEICARGGTCRYFRLRNCNHSGPRGFNYVALGPCPIIATFSKAFLQL